ncbi:MAG: hypothetical protein U0768_07980 [Anaerolineae bacterium]
MIFEDCVSPAISVTRLMLSSLHGFVGAPLNDFWLNDGALPKGRSKDGWTKCISSGVNIGASTSVPNATFPALSWRFPGARLGKVAKLRFE